MYTYAFDIDISYQKSPKKFRDMKIRAWRLALCGRKPLSGCEVKIAYIIARNNIAVLFGTLKVQSFMLTEVSDCDLLIVVTSSTFLKRKDMLKEKNS